MKLREAQLDHATLTRILDYNPETGVFTWKEPAANRVKIGDVAGNETWHGYWTIQIKYGYLAHRLAWFYVHNAWPEEEIDHADGNPLNNKIFNLRPVTSSQNKMNSRIRKNKKCEFKGVYIHKYDPLQYRARIRVDGRTVHLGLFPTAEMAHAAYVKASQQHHKEFGRTI